MLQLYYIERKPLAKARGICYYANSRTREEKLLTVRGVVRALRRKGTEAGVPACLQNFCFFKMPKRTAGRTGESAKRAPEAGQAS